MTDELCDDMAEMGVTRMARDLHEATARRHDPMCVVFSAVPGLPCNCGALTPKPEVTERDSAQDFLPIGTITSWGTVAAISYRDGERYYFFRNGPSDVGLIPAYVVEGKR